MLERRFPKGYEGISHETIGTDILAVMSKVTEPTAIAPSLARQLATVQPNGWYPIRWLLDLLDVVERTAGPVGLMRLGRAVFEQSHRERFIASAIHPKDVVTGIQAMYTAANRGERIGGWRVLECAGSTARLEKTTPHACMMEEGILSAAFAAIAAPVRVTHARCFNFGADACEFTMRATVANAPVFGPPIANSSSRKSANIPPEAASAVPIPEAPVAFTRALAAPPVDRTIRFEYDRESDVHLAIPYWRIDSEADCQQWFAQYEKYYRSLGGKVDVIFALHHFHVRPVIGPAWGKFRADMVQRFVRFSVRLEPDKLVRTFVLTSSILFGASSTEAPDLRSAIHAIKVRRTLGD